MDDFEARKIRKLQGRRGGEVSRTRGKGPGASSFEEHPVKRPKVRLTCCLCGRPLLQGAKASPPGGPVAAPPSPMVDSLARRCAIMNRWFWRQDGGAPATSPAVAARLDRGYIRNKPLEL